MTEILLTEYVCSAGCGHAARYTRAPQGCHRCDGDMITLAQANTRKAAVAAVTRGIDPADMRWAREAIITYVETGIEGIGRRSFSNLTPERTRAIRVILADLTLQAHGLRG